MELHHARSVSFEGKKVTCIAGSGTVSVGVIEYNPVQRESLVVDFSTGTGPTFMDVVKMFDSHPSSIVEFLSEEEQVLFSKVKSKQEMQVRPAKRMADKSIKDDSYDVSVDEPSPRRARMPRRAVKNQCSVCLDSECNMLAEACAHIAVCQQCAISLTACPICTSATAFRRVYFS
jgi:hypothetical protein